MLNVGVIGLGIGVSHIENYQKLDGVTIAAVADGVPERLQKYTDQGITGYDNFEALCDDPNIDAVSVCLPTFLHESAAVRAFESGKHVLCEKPLADSVESGEKIVAAARASGKTFMMNLHQRFTPGATHIRSLVDSGEFGEVYYSHSSYLRPPGGIPGGVGGWFYRKDKAGGGALIDNGVHLIDQQWFLMGCPTPVEAMGQTYTKFGPDLMGKDFDVDDFATGCVRFDNGASLIFDNAWASLVNEEVHFVRILGTKMGATAVPFNVVRWNGSDCEDATPDDVETENPIEHFVRCIREDSEPIITPEHGLTMLKILAALYRSAESGKSESV